MIAHIIGLYTRLMTYVRLHILTLVATFYHDTSDISFIPLFLILIILFFFISVIMLLLLILLLCTSTFPFTDTLIRSLLMTLDSYVQILDVSCYWPGVRWDRTLREELESLSCGSGILISLVFLSFHDSRYISDSILIPVLFIWYHAWMLLCNITVIVDLLQFRFITCSGLLKT